MNDSRLLDIQQYIESKHNLKVHWKGLHFSIKDDTLLITRLSDRDYYDNKKHTSKSIISRIKLFIVHLLLN